MPFDWTCEATISVGFYMLRGYECGCSGVCMLLEHELSYGLGINALVTACSWNANGIVV